jgi:hypothetical protein
VKFDPSVELQDAFMQTMGEPIALGEEQIVQGDRWTRDGPFVVEVRFIGDEIFDAQSARLSVEKPGWIELSDGSHATSVSIQDHADLPRFARHRVEPRGSDLFVYNAYPVTRSGSEYIESWTRNAGIVVTPLGETVRRYECSNGSGAFDRTNLIFEVAILPADAPWRAEEIYT